MKLFIQANLITILLTSILFGASCTRENPIEELIKYSDDISGRKVVYTVTALPADKYSKDNLFTDTVFVQLIMNGSMVSATCDANGLATFTNLATGKVSVSVETNGYINAYFTADLSLRDSTDHTDSNNMRRAASTILLFPETGNGTAKLTATAYADLDLNTAGNELITQSFASFISICPPKNSYTHTGEGEITELYYQKPTQNTLFFNNGTFWAELPSSISGLKVCINTDDLKIPQKQLDGTYIDKIFKFKTDTLNIISGKSYFHDFVLEN